MNSVKLRVLSFPTFQEDRYQNAAAEGHSEDCYSDARGVPSAHSARSGECSMKHALHVPSWIRNPPPGIALFGSGIFLLAPGFCLRLVSSDWNEEVVLSASESSLLRVCKLISCSRSITEYKCFTLNYIAGRRITRLRSSG